MNRGCVVFSIARVLNVLCACFSRSIFFTITTRRLKTQGELEDRAELQSSLDHLFSV